MKNIQIELTKSLARQTKRQIATVTSLGLKKMHDIVIQPDNEATRGKIHKVRHLLKCSI